MTKTILINSKLAIKRKKYIATTDGFGNCNLGLATDSIVVLQVTNYEGYICIPIAYHGNWVISVRNSEDTLVRNTSIGEIYAFYYDNHIIIEV